MQQVVEAGYDSIDAVIEAATKAIKAGQCRTVENIFNKHITYKTPKGEEQTLPILKIAHLLCKKAVQHEQQEIVEYILSAVIDVMQDEVNSMSSDSRISNISQVLLDRLTSTALHSNISSQFPFVLDRCGSVLDQIEKLSSDDNQSVPPTIYKARITLSNIFINCCLVNMAIDNAPFDDGQVKRINKALFFLVTDAINNNNVEQLEQVDKYEKAISQYPPYKYGGIFREVNEGKPFYYVISKELPNFYDRAANCSAKCAQYILNNVVIPCIKSEAENNEHLNGKENKIGDAIQALRNNINKQIASNDPPKMKFIRILEAFDTAISTIKRIEKEMISGGVFHHKREFLQQIVARYEPWRRRIHVQPSKIVYKSAEEMMSKIQAIVENKGNLEGAVDGDTTYLDGADDAKESQRVSIAMLAEIYEMILRQANTSLDMLEYIGGLIFERLSAEAAKLENNLNLKDNPLSKICKKFECTPNSIQAYKEILTEILNNCTRILRDLHDDKKINGICNLYNLALIAGRYSLTNDYLLQLYWEQSLENNTENMKCIINVVIQRVQDTLKTNSSQQKSKSIDDIMKSHFSPQFKLLAILNNYRVTLQGWEKIILQPPQPPRSEKDCLESITNAINPGNLDGFRKLLRQGVIILVETSCFDSKMKKQVSLDSWLYGNKEDISIELAHYAKRKLLTKHIDQFYHVAIENDAAGIKNYIVEKMCKSMINTKKQSPFLDIDPESGALKFTVYLGASFLKAMQDTVRTKCIDVINKSESNAAAKLVKYINEFEGHVTLDKIATYWQKELNNGKPPHNPGMHEPDNGNNLNSTIERCNALDKLIQREIQLNKGMSAIGEFHFV